MVIRPRRSVLYMPGANARALEKARTLDADAFIFDLEDAVAPDMKTTARDQVIQNVAKGGYRGREIIIRINRLDTPWGGDDIKAVAGSGCDAVLLPKVETAEEVLQAAQCLEDHGADDDLAIWAMIETPKAILNAEAIAQAHPRLSAFVMGTSDLVKDLHARYTSSRKAVLYALSHTLMAARAYGLCALDGVHLHLESQTGFHESCLQGRDLGFDGKTLIHPKQIASANAVYGPSEDEIEEAENIIQAFDEAMAQGKAVAVYDGKLIELLHVEAARHVIALANAITDLSAY